MNFADISHHQSDPINWAVYGATRDRVALKATQGRNFIDSKFAQRWKNAKTGLVRYRLAYHYQEPDNNGATDFNNFVGVIQSVGGLTPNDILVVDVEKLTSTNKVHPRARAATIEFCNKAVAMGYPKGIIYSYRYYLDTANIVASDLPSGWRQLWLADYTIGQADSAIEVPPGWDRNSQVIARQYTDKASVAGLTGQVDDSRVLKDWFKTTTTPTTPGDDWMSSDDALGVLKHMDGNIETIIRQGFRSTNANNEFDEASVNNSINGVNKKLFDVSSKLSNVATKEQVEETNALLTDTNAKLSTLVDLMTQLANAPQV